MRAWGNGMVKRRKRWSERVMRDLDRERHYGVREKPGSREIPMIHQG